MAGTFEMPPLEHHKERPKVVGIAMEDGVLSHAVAQILTALDRYKVDIFNESDVDRGSWPETPCAAVVASPKAFQSYRAQSSQTRSSRARSREAKSDNRNGFRSNSHVDAPVILALGSRDFCRHKEKIAAADGFVLTDDTLMRLPSLVVLSAHGLSVIPARININIGGFSVDPRLSILSNLSTRDRQVLAELSLGRDNEAIADKLGMTLSMAKVHVRRINVMFGFKNRTEAAVFAAALLIANDLEANTSSVTA